MDLSSAKKQYSTLGEQGSATPDHRERANVQATTAEAHANFFEIISMSGFKPAILSIVSPYNAGFVRGENKTMPKPLTELFSEENVEETLQELQQKSETAFNELEISIKEAENVEEATRDQADSIVWFEQRTGRVTASKFKAACSTNPDKPSKSLIKMICYPSAHLFSKAATKWGISNESEAREAYEFSIPDQHLNLSVADSGLHIKQNWPFLGASPDGLVFCECCGKGLCEAKCPYKCKDAMLVAAAVDSIFCLKYDDNGVDLCLDTVHAYYYQLQWQLFVSGVLRFCCLDYKGPVCSASVA